MTTTGRAMATAERRLLDATVTANTATAIRDLTREAEAIAARRRDVIGLLTDADRETALLRFADLAVQGAFPEEVLPPVIRRLARCADPMLRFHDLCEAVRARGEFDDEPVDFAAERDLSCSAEAIANLRDRLAGDVTWAVRVLLDGA